MVYKVLFGAFILIILGIVLTGNGSKAVAGLTAAFDTWTATTVSDIGA